MEVCSATIRTSRERQWNEKKKGPHRTSWKVRCSCLFQVRYKKHQEFVLSILLSPAMPASHTKTTAVIYFGHDPSLLLHSEDKALPCLLSSSSINLRMYKFARSAVVLRKVASKAEGAKWKASLLLHSWHDETFLKKEKYIVSRLGTPVKVS